MADSPFDPIRRPEYTGDNRCWPCTVVNTVIVFLAAVAVAPFSPFLSLLVLLVGGGLIALRGYVVPRTPEFAPKLVAPLPFDFGHERPYPDGGPDRNPGESDSLDDDDDGEAVLGALFEAGVVVEGDDGDVYLADDVRAAWERTVTDLREADDDELARRTAAAVPFEATGDVEGDWVYVEGNGREAWLTRVVAVAETAAAEVLADAGVDPAVAAQAATPLRMFVDTCPLCGGDVVETTLRDCCGGTRGVHARPEHEVLACADCDAVVYEFEDVDV